MIAAREFISSASSLLLSPATTYGRNNTNATVGESRKMMLVLRNVRVRAHGHIAGVVFGFSFREGKNRTVLVAYRMNS